MKKKSHIAIVLAAIAAFVCTILNLFIDNE